MRFKIIRGYGKELTIDFVDPYPVVKKDERQPHDRVSPAASCHFGYIQIIVYVNGAEAGVDLAPK